ncbi:MAG: hypothetical protein HZB10_01655 [Candidatus Yonathbacteria bacterium]|nr:hypothetical protein [Candidatus Yonathbacteria bacterium]
MEQTLKSSNFFKKLGILVGFITEVIVAIFSQMTDAQLQYYIGKKETIRKQLLDMFNQTDLYVEKHEDWRKFYQKYFSLDVNVADVSIPEKPTEGDWCLLVIARGLTLNQVYDCMSKAFGCSRYSNDLDASITKNVRDTKETYAIWVRVGVEPDEKYLGKSANQADPDMKIGVTLLERMLLEIVYFYEKGKHLDVVGWTRCTSSRDADGNVPCVSLSGDKVLVGWDNPGYSGTQGGLREAVSHSPE